MFSSTQGAQASENVTYRLTDLHQPQTVNLLTTPVPKCPEDPKVQKVETCHDSTGFLEAENIPERTILEILNLLEGVDIGFLKRRRGCIKASTDDTQTPLMNIFEERSPKIFDTRSGCIRNGRDDSGAGEKRSQAELNARVGRTAKARKVRISSHIKIDDYSNRSGDQGVGKETPRVSLKNLTDAKSLPVTQSLNKKEAEQKACQDVSSALNLFSRTFSDGDLDSSANVESMNPAEILKGVQSLASDVLRLSSHVEVFEELLSGDLPPVLDILSNITSLGSQILLNTSQSEKSEESLRVLAALEALILIERLILIVSNSTIISEERLRLCIETTRFHMHSNVLPFYDGKMRVAIRSDIIEEGRNKKTGSRRQNQRIKVPKVVEHVHDRVLTSLDLITEIIGTVKIQTHMLSPTVRTVIQSTTVEGLSEMQSKAVRLLAAVYCSCPDLRHPILKDCFVALTPFLGVGKKCRRDIQLAYGDNAMQSVNVMSALILHTVQTCAHYPTLCSIDAVRTAYSTCIQAADWFWELCMERVCSAKTIKMETDADLGCAMLGIVQDILEISSSIYWPCASATLIRLASMLNGPMGLQSQDPFVRQVCVDIMGKILAFVHKDSTTLNKYTDRFEEIVEDIDYGNISDAAGDLVLSCLTASDVEIAHSAKRFLCLQKLCEQCAKLQEQSEDEDEIQREFSKSFASFSEILQQHGSLLPVGSLIDEDTMFIMKAIVHEQFLSAAPAMLSWMMQMLESKHQSSSVRSKVVRALGDIVSVDKRLLDIPGMLAAIEHALQDDSISVREAALVLVGKHMVQDYSLAIRLLNIVIKAADDPGSSVRRSAIRILRDCALVIPQEYQNKVVDAYKAILNRSTDSEESVKSIVLKIFKSLWFDSIIEGEDGLKVMRSPSDRAQSLASLANAVITSISSNTSGVRSLVDRSNPLIVLLTDIYEDDKGEGYGDKKAGESKYLETSVALLDSFIYSEDTKLPYLFAIYSMALSHPESCIPDNDPLKFLRAIAPQIKILTSRETQGTAEVTEEILYVLGILSSILVSMEQSRMIVMDLATEISEELPNLINTHKFTVIVSAACACLSACALSSPTATGRFLNVVAQYASFLESPKLHSKNLPRFIFILGQVYRNGSRVLQQVELYLPDQPILAKKLTSESCIKLLLRFWTMDVDGSPALAAQIRRSSLEAICQVIIPSPWLALDGDCGAQMVISEALLSKSPPMVKLAALNGLIEFLQADAHALSQRQIMHPTSIEPDAISISISKAVVASENGDGESSHGGAILQNHWDAILSLAAETHPKQNNVDNSSILIKKRILCLIEIAVRDGLVGPWTAVPTLVLLAMETHASQDISARSIKLLKLLSNKYPQYVDAGRLVKGVKDAHILYIKDAMKRSRDTGTHIPEDIRLAQSRLKRLYLDIVSTSRSKRNEFLRLLIRSFRRELISTKEGGTRRSSLGTDDASYPPSLWPCLALLISSIPLKKYEEVCIVVHEIDAAMAYKVPSTIAELHEFIESDTPVTHPAVRTCASRAKILCILLRLKRYLMNGYGISAERQAVFAASTKRSSSGATKLSSDGVFADPVHFNARNTGESGIIPSLCDIFTYRQELNTSGIAPNILHPLLQGPAVTTHVVDLKKLFDELDGESEGSPADNFDPMNQ